MRPPLPEAVLLTGRPFTVAQAARCGVSRKRLQAGHLWRQVCREVYVAADVPDSHGLRLAAARLVIPPDAVVSGASAAWLLGVDILRGVDDPVEVTLPRGRTLRGRGVLRPLQAQLLPGDVEVRDGIAVTTPLRTAFDLARRPDTVEAVVALDALWHFLDVPPDQVVAYALTQPGLRGVRRVPRVAELADRGAESPMESRIRMLVVLVGGLPAPETQIDVFRPDGVFAGRVDMGYRGVRFGWEYDGQIHGEAPVRIRDRRRHNDLLKAQWEVPVYTGTDYYRRPQLIISDVRAGLLRPRIAI